MRVNIICFNFKESNIRLQPRRYLYEIAKYLLSQNFNVRLISDGYPSYPKEGEIHGLKIRRVNKLRSALFAPSKELNELIKGEDPHIIIWLMGMTSFLRPSALKKIEKPIIGILTSPIYSIREIMKVGMKELVRHYDHVFIDLLGVIIPRYLIRRVVGLPNFLRLVVLSKSNQDKLANIGVPLKKLTLLPSGIDAFYLDFSEEDQPSELNGGSFVILYLGSPLTLRGADTLIEALGIAKKRASNLKLIILSRLEDEGLVKEEIYLRKLIAKKGLESCVEIVSGSIDRNTVRRHIASVDLVVLPFKIVQSDVPISLLEVMSLEKPLISTDVDGIPELLENGRGIIVRPNDPGELADSIIKVYSDPNLMEDVRKKAREYMVKHPTWEEIGEEFTKLIHQIKETGNQ